MPTQSEIINANFKYLNGKIDEIELFKFPNAIITGNPDIDHGQVSNFSNVDFLQFPFLVDLTNRRFRAEFCFTTGDDVTTQQNILDSEFGLALAIKNGKGLMAIGHNGTSWAGQVVGNFNIQPRTTYYAKLIGSRINYQTQLSDNGTDYTIDMNFGSTQSPYPRTMFIGGSPDLFGPGTAHPFKGSINLNKCFLYIEEQLVWQGMDDAGLATRADVSLDNLDAAGQAKFDAKQNKLNQGDNIILTPQEDGTVTISATGGGASISTIIDKNSTDETASSSKAVWDKVNVLEDKYVGGDADYVVEGTGKLANVGGRDFLKNREGLAYGMVYKTNAGYMGCVLASETADAVRIDPPYDEPAGTFEYGGKTYYYSTGSYFMPSGPIELGLLKIDTTETMTFEDSREAGLYCVQQGFSVLEKGLVSRVDDLESKIGNFATKEYVDNIVGDIETQLAEI